MTGSEQREAPQPLSEQFYKARKSLVLFSGLLFAWEFIGFELREATVAGTEVTIQNPEAAPFVLAVVVGYFLGRTVIEWFQSPEDARSRRVSQIDFGGSTVIPAVALLTFLVQQISGVRVADYVTVTTSIMFTIGASSAPSGASYWHLAIRQKPLIDHRYLRTLLPKIFCMLALFLFSLPVVIMVGLSLETPTPNFSAEPMRRISLVLGTLFGWAMLGIWIGVRPWISRWTHQFWSAPGSG